MTLSLEVDAERWARSRRNLPPKQAAASVFDQSDLVDIHRCTLISPIVRGSRLKLTHIAGGLWPLPWRVHYHGEWVFFAKTEVAARKFAEMNGWYLDYERSA